MVTVTQCLFFVAEPLKSLPLRWNIALVGGMCVRMTVRLHAALTHMLAWSNLARLCMAL